MDLLDLAVAKALRAFDRVITGLAGATESAAKRAAATSKSLKKASATTRSRAAAAAGEDTGAWDSAAAAAAKRYERRAAMEALLLCALVGFVVRLLLGDAGVVPTLRALLAPVVRFLADPGATPVEAWEWLVGTGPRAARAAGGQMYTLPPVEGALHRLFVALAASLPSVEHSLIMVRRRSQCTRAARRRFNRAPNTTLRQMPECPLHAARSRAPRPRAQTLILGAGFAAYRYGFEVLTELSGPREAELVRAELRKRVAAAKALLSSGRSA